MPQPQKPSPGKVIPLPRTRVLSWSAMLVESSQQLVLAVWIGSLTAVAALAVPTLLTNPRDPAEAVRIALDLLGKIGFLGCGAGSFLILITLLMYQLAMRSVRGTLAQLAMLLVMTGIAVGLQVWLAPAISTLVRSLPDLFSAEHPPAEAARFRTLFGAYLALLVGQALVGSGLLLTGVRRWYRYLATGTSREIFWP